MGIEKNEKPNIFTMIWSPIEQFEKIRQKPLILFPILIVTFIYIVAYTLLAISLNVEDVRLSGMTLDEAEMVLAISKATTAISGFFIPIFSIFLATIIQLIIIKIAKKNVTFKQLLSMNSHIAIIGAIGILLNYSISLLWAGESKGLLWTSLAGILQNNSAILESFEIFSIWQYILTAIGLFKVGQLSKKVSAILIILLFLFTLGMAIFGTVMAKVINL